MSKFCGKCGYKVDDTKRYCPKCGKSINEEVGAGGDKNHTWLKKGVAVGFMILALSGGYYFYNNYGSEISDSNAEDIVLQSDKKIRDIVEYVELKDKYNQDIADTAQNINNYVAQHGDLKGAVNILDNASKLKEKILQTRRDFVDSYTMKTIIGNGYYKTLLDLYDLEIIRIKALEDGVREGINGGNMYVSEFRRGTEASYKYDDLDLKFRKMVH